VRLDVFFGTHQVALGDTAGRLVAVIDVRLAGEQKMLPIPGFDPGNSPREFTTAAVAAKTVLICTTHGTGALTAVQGPRDVVVASYVNLTAVLALFRATPRGGTDIAVVCAGRGRQFSLEDGGCAGRYVNEVARRLTSVDLNDAALAASLIDQRYGDN
jgi:2-phosphosulfolactate phosphatase